MRLFKARTRETCESHAHPLNRNAPRATFKLFFESTQRTVYLCDDHAKGFKDYKKVKEGE